MKTDHRKLNRISLLLVFALLGVGLILPANFAGAGAQSDKGDKAEKAKSKPKSFGHKRETVSIKPPGRTEFLTGPNKDKPLDVAVGFLKQNRQKLDLEESDLLEVKVMDQYTSKHNGVTHIYLRQEIDGIEVVGAELGTNVTKDGKVINLHSSFVKGLKAAAKGRIPYLSPAQAVEAVARHLELTITEPLEVLETQAGPQQETTLSKGGVSLDPIRVKLIYQPVDENNVRLAWSVEVSEVSGEHWWNISVDAETAEILAGYDYGDHDNWGEGFVPDIKRNRNLAARSYAAAPTALTTLGPPATVNDGSAYNVFAFPFESPTDGANTLVMNPADALSSPFGWHDTNGAAGPEFTRTRGNNVHAYTDVDANGVVDANSDPDGGANLQFNFPLDPTQGPAANRPPAVVNLFYWNNIIHDVFYRYGFTELSGNFQVNNYGRGPVDASNLPVGGNDDVRAEAQDGSGTNNANFFTPVDGSRPRMQMFVWTFPFANVVIVNPPSAIANTYIATGASFGPPVTAAGFTGDVVLGLDAADAAGPSTTDGCSPLTNAGEVVGKIALVDRGGCNFTVKVKTAQDAGAIGVIVGNNAPGAPVTMGFTAPIPVITIPSVMVSMDNASLYKANLPFNASVKINPNPPPNRDSDFDAGVIAHEYGHGISNRLTGGRTVVNCLNNQEQMGEGWSDFLGLVVTTDPSDTAATPRGIGTYVSFQPGNGRGIRPNPYTTDMSVNPTTYGNIGGLAIPHGVGYAWATMLWEMYWNLVGVYGYNPNLYDPWDTGGNNLAIQLVMDGMKLQPCRPGFVNGRDAILQADMNLTGGANECLIWKAFAKRGLGVNASQGSNNSVTDGTQNFELPTVCRAQINAAPPSLTETLKPNTQSTQNLTISNNAKAFGADLNWTITETVSDCATPSDVSWVSASPTSGTTAAQGLSNVTVAFDSTGLGIGPQTAKLCVSSDAGNQEILLTLNAIYNFAGFFSPIANLPALNDPNSGSTVPVKFSLNGNYGLDIFASGNPASRQVDCGTLNPTGAWEATGTPGQSALSYDPSTDSYNYPWKTSGSWKGTCRELSVRLNDGIERRAYFNFTK